jgi:hypothetical protein
MPVDLVAVEIRLNVDGFFSNHGAMAMDEAPSPSLGEEALEGLVGWVDKEDRAVLAVRGATKQRSVMVEAMARMGHLVQLGEAELRAKRG